MLSSAEAARRRSNAATPKLRIDNAGHVIQNELLSSLSEGEFTVLRPHLEWERLPSHRVLHESGEEIESAFFLNEGITSLIVSTHDGRSVEVGVVAREGFVGTPLAAGLRRSPYRAIMQISGNGFRIKSGVLDDLLLVSPTLRSELLRYALVQGFQVAQIAVCNRLHEIDQRLARWLLMCRDRVDSPQLPLTHEFLAQLLGTGRPSVSLSLAAFEQLGLIENVRGGITVLDIQQLKNAACECYQAIQEFNGELGLETVGA
ncbi:MAG: Crp/Fnr family transcriptional regulator [Terriglobales bacterium]